MRNVLCETFCAKRFVRNVLCETFCAKRFVRNVLCETFCAKRFGQFFLEPHFESGAAWAGRAGLGWAGLGTGPGLGWPMRRVHRAAGRLGWLGLGGLGWAGLGWAGLGWGGLAGLGWAGLGWAGLGWAGLGLGWLGGWAILKRKLVYSKIEIGLFENGKVCLHRKNKLPNDQQQQAISIYFFLEGLGFRVYRNC